MNMAQFWKACRMNEKFSSPKKINNNLCLPFYCIASEANNEAPVLKILESGKILIVTPYPIQILNAMYMFPNPLSETLIPPKV